MAAAMVPQAWNTSHMPRSELRDVSRLHSSDVKTVLGSTRATTGIGGSFWRMIRPLDCSSIRRVGDDVDLRGKGAMHGALVGNFHQFLALFGIQGAFHGNHPV